MQSPVPARLSPTLDVVIDACGRDPRIDAAWLGGSVARGIADDWSDLDLHLAVDDADSFDVPAWITAVVSVVLVDAIPGLQSAWIVLTPDWVHLDVVVHPASEDVASHLPCLPLKDTRNRLTPTKGEPGVGGEPYFPSQQVRIFLYFMGNAVTVLNRGELIALSQGTATMRDQYLVPLMLAENGIHKSDGAKRLNRYLTDQQRDALAALPPITLAEADLRSAQEAIAIEYLTRAHALALRCGATWPTELEQAARDFWERELGISLPLHDAYDIAEGVH